MRRFRNIFLVSFPAVFLIFNLSCASLKNSQYTEAPPNQLFVSSISPLENPDAFSRWLGPVSEFDKIDYLLERMAHSDHRFIRNGVVHNGKVARRWLLYKMIHWVRGVDTAEEFVTRVASYSQKTGESYLVVFPEGKCYSLSSVLRNELFAFETQRARLRPLAQQDSLTRPGQASLSPTAVATSAVAHSTSS